MDFRQNVKWVAMFVAPLLLFIAVAYVFVRSQNRSLQAKASAVQMQNDVMQGELYRLRQEIEGRDARIRQLVNPELKRLKAESTVDSTSFLLFWRENGGDLYVEVSHVRIPKREEHYRIYWGDGPEHVGNFEALSETIGLQRVGKVKSMRPLKITRALRDSEPDFDQETLSYQVSTAD